MTFPCSNTAPLPRQRNAGNLGASGQEGRHIRVRRHHRVPRSSESGYTLLLCLFIAAAMIIAASEAVPNMITESRRQKEKLMIWRGRQYERAIGLYYRKTGHYPPNLKILAKDVNGVYVLRKRYKDPMNTRDGSWRLIYLGPGGVFIGSLCWHTLAEYEAYEKGVPLAPGNTQSNSSSSGNSPSTLSQYVTGCPALNARPNGSSSSQLKQRIIREGDMVGGSLIGVAGVVNAKSIRVFKGADNYRDWEFIWNPLQGQSITAMPGSVPPGSPAQKIPLMNPKTPLIQQQH